VKHLMKFCSVLTHSVSMTASRRAISPGESREHCRLLLSEVYRQEVTQRRNIKVFQQSFFRMWHFSIILSRFDTFCSHVPVQASQFLYEICDEQFAWVQGYVEPYSTARPGWLHLTVRESSASSWMKSSLRHAYDILVQ